MIALGVLLALLSFAGPISHFLEDNVAAQIREASRVVSRPVTGDRRSRS